MSTPAQINANQQNATHSTGPRTIEGKAKSAANSTRHGFRSQTVLLPGDDPAEYEALLQELTTEYRPAGLAQTRHLREMADAEWRLRRVRAMIEALLTAKIAELPEGPAALRQAQAYEATRTNPIFKFEGKFERQYDRALKALLALKKTVVARIERELDSIEASLKQNVTNEPNSTPLTPRNAPCPCGSREKYKRCCGKNAPPVLNAA